MIRDTETNGKYKTVANRYDSSQNNMMKNQTQFTTHIHKVTDIGKRQPKNMYQRYV